MDGHDGLLGALLGAVVIGSVIGVTSSATRRRYQASGAQPRGRAVRACRAGLDQPCRSAGAACCARPAH